MVLPRFLCNRRPTTVRRELETVAVGYPKTIRDLSDPNALRVTYDLPITIVIDLAHTVYSRARIRFVLFLPHQIVLSAVGFLYGNYRRRSEMIFVRTITVGFYAGTLRSKTT
jgi:hypothetical protein